jgi:hypothetical protein
MGKTRRYLLARSAWISRLHRAHISRAQDETRTLTQTTLADLATLGRIRERLGFRRARATTLVSTWDLGKAYIAIAKAQTTVRAILDTGTSGTWPS